MALVLSSAWSVQRYHLVVVLVVGGVDMLDVPKYQAKALPSHSCQCQQWQHPRVSSTSLEALLWYSWASFGGPLGEIPVLVV
jgi:hypothetical protein